MSPVSVQEGCGATKGKWRLIATHEGDTYRVKILAVPCHLEYIVMQFINSLLQLLIDGFDTHRHYLVIAHPTRFGLVDHHP